jgi:hypothetical protein
MADVKISGLPASTLPLAGTEVLPLVQSGVTKKVASDDLTVKNVRSNATTGILQVAGPAIGATRVMTTPDANFTVARTDAGQTFTGAQNIVNASGGTTASNYLVVRGTTVDNLNYPAVELQGGSLYQAGRDPKLQLANAGLGVGLYAGYLNATFTAQYAVYMDSSVGLQLQSSASGAPVSRLNVSSAGDVTVNTGNLVIGTSGKGIDFTATPGAGTSELLNDYEEGTFTPTWTPASGSGQNVNNAYGYYTKVGNCVFVTIYIGTNGHGTASGTVTIGGLPFSPVATGFQKGGFYCVSASASGLGAGRVPTGAMNYGAASFTPVAWGLAGGSFVAMSAADWGVSGECFFVGSYQTT